MFSLGKLTLAAEAKSEIYLSRLETSPERYEFPQIHFSYNHRTKKDSATIRPLKFFTDLQNRINNLCKNFEKMNLNTIFLIYNYRFTISSHKITVL